MQKIKPSKFQTLLLSWFDQHGRKHLPWQENKTPYRVWVSEIMLQQTQVATVIPYFERFMSTFKSVSALAKAPEDTILHLWAGLGYYSRARNLHKAAKKIMADFGGKFPRTQAELESLPGIGSSTAGAIQAIAFNQQATILDGNVKRVLSRLHGILEPINEKSTENTLWEIAQSYTPKERVADYTQAMMDLGATLCTRSKPQCPTCPLRPYCVAYDQALTHIIPQKKTGSKIPTREATFIIFKKGQQVLLQKRPPMGIWGSLYCLPELSGAPEKAAVQVFCQQSFNIKPRAFQKLPSFRHTFSHYHLELHPIMIEVEKWPAKVMDGVQQIWYNPKQPDSVGLPKPIQSIMKAIT